ncbi:unnamed protein product [Meganyctiphanes norvegica]|uniref:BAAT/Acyl-CoA thioester hydrolase C-terminal domain-containing protein n=1 Tax=Meganyctiphanes norvegica TaxID=48144 RepID=A0AAV2RZ01_MEGNR
MRSPHSREGENKMIYYGDRIFPVCPFNRQVVIAVLEAFLFGCWKIACPNKIICIFTIYKISQTISLLPNRKMHWRGSFGNHAGLLANVATAADDQVPLKIMLRHKCPDGDRVEFNVQVGHVDVASACSSSNRILCSTSHVRHYMSPGVTRTLVTTGKLRAAFFEPPGDGPFPGVVDVFGSAGGLMESRAAQLASRGFAAIAVAYLNYQDIPNDGFIDFDYFREAVHYLLNHEKVLKSGVGCVGVSKGGDIVLSMATYIPEVRCAISINGCNAVIGVPTKIDSHTTIPAIPFNVDGIINKSDGSIEGRYALHDPAGYPECIVPIEQSDSEFLFLVSLDDKDMDSSYYADCAVNRLREAARKNFVMIKYPDTGHLLEPPYSPHCFSSYHRMMDSNLVWGGELKPHCEAQEHAWAASIDFLRKHLVTSHL